MSGVREARRADAEAIRHIWNPVIRDTLITFNSAEKTVEDVVCYIEQRQSAGHGVFVIEHHGAVAGFASYGQFRGGVGYARTMEHTVLLGPKARRLGLGRALMTAVEAHAAQAGAHSMFAGVSAVNVAGVAFHSRIGYREICRLPEVGYKFGQYLDLVLMQKILAGPDRSAV